MNPENREIDYRNILSVANTGLINRVQLKGHILDGTSLPISVSNNFDLYYGGQYHSDMISNYDEVLMEGYAKYQDGKVEIWFGNQHKHDVDPKLIEAARDLLEADFTKLIKENNYEQS